MLRDRHIAHQRTEQFRRLPLWHVWCFALDLLSAVVGGEMSEEGDGLPVVRVKFACANVEEFRRKFEPNLLAKGMLARTPQMHETGRRVMLRLELQDGSLGVDEEAVVQALEWTGGKQAMRLQLVRAKQPGTPAPAAPAPRAARPAAAVAPPPSRVATGTAIPAVTDWAAKPAEKPPERARTDTEATRAMSLDELLNALPPTAKPKLTPSGGVPHLNGASTRPNSPFQGGGFNPVPPSPPPSSVTPLAPPIASPRAPPAAPAPVPVQTFAAPPQTHAPPEQAYPPPPQVYSPPSAAPAAAVAPSAASLPVPAQLSEIEPPPSIRPMTPMYPMPTPFPSTPAHEAAAPIPVPEPAPEQDEPAKGRILMSAADFKASLTGEVTLNPASTPSVEPSDSTRESIRPEAEPGVDPAGPTVFNTATEATTASNATVAVPGLASEVAAAKRRGPGRAIATFVLFLAALSGAGAYLWRTGKLEQYAPMLAARLPPSPASITPPAPATAAPASAETPKTAAAEAPKPPAETPKTVAAAEAPKPPPPPAEAPKPAIPAAEAAPPAPATEAPKPPAAADGSEVTLSITTQPPGAKVLANGEQVGVAPLELPWVMGKPIKLRFTKPGFKAAVRNFTPNATGTLDVTLAPSAAQPDELKDVY